MLSRRVLLVGGAVLAGGGAAALVATDRLDDTLDTLGVRPRPQPDERDVARLAAARAELDALARLAESEQVDADLVAVLRAQATGLPPTTESATLAPPFVEACRMVAEARATDALEAIAPEVSVVCGSITAGLDEVVAAVEAS